MDRERLEKLLKMRKMTVAELERTLNMGNGTLRKSNNIQSSRLSEIADFFGVSMEYLMGKSEKIPEYDLFIQDFIDIIIELSPEQKNILLETARIFAYQNGVKQIQSKTDKKN